MDFSSLYNRVFNSLRTIENKNSNIILNLSSGKHCVLTPQIFVNVICEIGISPFITECDLEIRGKDILPADKLLCDLFCEQKN